MKDICFPVVLVSSLVTVVAFPLPPFSLAQDEFQCTDGDHCKTGECMHVVDGADKFYVCCVKEAGKMRACVQAKGCSCPIFAAIYNSTCSTCLSFNACMPTKNCQKGKVLGKKQVNSCLKK